ncbi:MAG: hypothetical protein DME15_00505 [Candidatus Rokuibacteriota bacterium]|nr:MAG: hypothetical protein DME15_00505 [Candidatus Rokubacteria bacterium]
MRLLGVLASALALAACAPEIVRQPTQLTSVTEQAGGTIEILEDTSILVGPAGYRRVIGRGSVWTTIGRVVEGEVYKPVNRVFTIEGAQIHDAYLVLDGDRVVGFYLPVERAFSPAPGGPGTRLSIRRREP